MHSSAEGEQKYFEQKNILFRNPPHITIMWSDFIIIFSNTISDRVYLFLAAVSHMLGKLLH